MRIDKRSTLPRGAIVRRETGLYGDEDKNYKIDCERDFIKKLKKVEIPENYFADIQEFFKRMETKMIIDMKNSTDVPKEILICDVYQIKSIVRRDNTVLFENISVRPCAWTQGFFRLLIWKIVKVCFQHELNLEIVDPRQRTVKHLKKSFPKFKGPIEDPYTWTYMLLKNEYMRRIDLQNLSFNIDKIKWPTAAQLNDRLLHPLCPARY